MFLLSHASIKEIVENVGYVISEPDHNMADTGLLGTVWQKCLNVARGIFKQFFPVVNIFNVFWTIGVLIKKDKKKLFIPTVAMIFVMWVMEVMVGHYAIVNGVLSLACFLCIDLYLIYYPFARKYGRYIILTLILCFSVLMGSNTGMQSPMEMLIFMLVIMFCMFGDNDNYHLRMHSKRWFTCLLVGILGLVFVVRMDIFWRNNLSVFDYKYQMSDGPYKGLWTTKETYDWYEETLNKYKKIDIHPEDKLFVAAAEPMAYLYLESEYGTFGTPFFYLDYDRLENYYELHPDKFPTIVYYPSVSEEDKKSWFWKKITENSTLQSLDEGVVIYMDGRENIE